jgi:hypothetical protein
MTIYLDRLGRRAYVCKDHRGEWFAVREMWTYPSGRRSRIAPSRLPTRLTADEARADLDAYARRLGWSAIAAEGIDVDAFVQNDDGVDS